MVVDVAVRWGKGYDSTVRSFVNVIATPKGGTHVLRLRARAGPHGQRIYCVSPGCSGPATTA